MCGIAGGQGLLLPIQLKQMIMRIAHRGPDYIGADSFDDVHLAHARLSIIDRAAHSNQPFWDINSQACIVFNGEIYNYQALREELLQLGYVFKTQGDTEVLLTLYIHYGVDALSKVKGIFAFAIWDARSDILFLARDPHGVKPIYYTVNMDGFYFASEIKSLLCLDSISHELNYDALLRYIVLLMCPGATTIFKDVLKLESGHYLIVKKRCVVKHEAYDQWPVYEPHSQSIQHICGQIDDSLRASVQSQLIADVPIGVMLSGGLDSSLITAMVMQMRKTPIDCFTVQSLGSGKKIDGIVDDLPYAKIVAKFLKVPLHIVDIKPNMANLLPKIMYHLDEPQADPAVLNVFLICELAKKKGIKVLLSGAGGDDIFSGYRRHQAIRFEHYWSFLPHFLRQVLQHMSCRLPKNIPIMRRFAKLFSYAAQSPEKRLLSYFYWIPPDIVHELFTDEIRQKLCSDPFFAMAPSESLRHKNGLEAMLDLEKHYFLVDHNLHYIDKMSMAHGIEVRVPFLDAGVLRTAAHIPSSFKHRYGRGKWILKQVAKRYLPSAIIYRRKTGFGAPLRQWLHNDLRSLVEETLSVETIQHRGIFKPEKVRALIDKDRTGKEDYSYPIFALLCFELWCRAFLDKEATPQNEHTVSAFDYV